MKSIYNILLLLQRRVYSCWTDFANFARASRIGKSPVQTVQKSFSFQLVHYLTHVWLVFLIPHPTELEQQTLFVAFQHLPSFIGCWCIRRAGETFREIFTPVFAFLPHEIFRKDVPCWNKFDRFRTFFHRTFHQRFYNFFEWRHLINYLSELYYSAFNKNFLFSPTNLTSRSGYNGD